MQGRPSFRALHERLQMAYDMLFAADDGAEIAVKLDTDYGDMDQVYLGVPVPSLENLDENYLAPTPLPDS